MTRAGAPEGPQQAPAPTSQHNLMPGPGMPWMPWMSFPFCMPPGEVPARGGRRPGSDRGWGTEPQRPSMGVGPAP